VILDGSGFFVSTRSPSASEMEWYIVDGCVMLTMKLGKEEAKSFIGI